MKQRTAREACACTFSVNVDGGVAQPVLSASHGKLFKKSSERREGVGSLTSEAVKLPTDTASRCAGHRLERRRG